MLLVLFVMIKVCDFGRDGDDEDDGNVCIKIDVCYFSYFVFRSIFDWVGWVVIVFVLLFGI